MVGRISDLSRNVTTCGRSLLPFALPLRRTRCKCDESKHKIRRRVTAFAYDVSCQTLRARIILFYRVKG